MSNTSKTMSLSKKLIKIMLPTAAMLVLGWQSGSAQEAFVACPDRTLEAKNGKADVCVGARIFGDYHVSIPEDEDVNDSRKWMDYRLHTFFRAALPTSNGWTASANAQVRANDTEFYVREAYVNVNRGMFDVFAGKIRVGDIDRGNAYTSELGHTFDGYYGDLDVVQPNFGLTIKPVDGLALTAAYSARRGDVSWDPTQTNEGNHGVSDLVATYDKGPLRVGVEFENHAYEDNKQNVAADGTDNKIKRAQNAFGLGAQYTIMEKFTPFVNLGSYKLNDPADQKEDISKSETNIGIDVKVTNEIGVTAAFETFADDTEYTDKNGKNKDSKDLNNAYISAACNVGAATVYVGYWSSSQKLEDMNGNQKGQFDVELTMSF